MVSRLRRTALYATSVLNAMSSWSVFLEMSTGINGETRDASVAETLGASTRRPSGTSADEAHSLSPFAATSRCSLMPAIRLSFHNLSVMGTKSKAYGGRLVIRSGCVKGGSTASEPFKHFVRNVRAYRSDCVWKRLTPTLLFGGDRSGADPDEGLGCRGERPVALGYEHEGPHKGEPPNFECANRRLRTDRACGDDSYSRTRRDRAQDGGVGPELHRHPRRDSGGCQRILHGPAGRRPLLPQHQRSFGEIPHVHLTPGEWVVGGDRHDKLVLPDDGTCQSVIPHR